MFWILRGVVSNVRALRSFRYRPSQPCYLPTYLPFRYHSGMTCCACTLACCLPRSGMIAWSLLHPKLLTTPAARRRRRPLWLSSCSVGRLCARALDLASSPFPAAAAAPPAAGSHGMPGCEPPVAQRLSQRARVSHRVDFCCFPAARKGVSRRHKL